MNLFDIVVAGIAISSTLLGLHKGLIRLTLSFISFLCSIVGSFFLFPIVKAAVLEHVNTEIVADIVSGLVAYLISMLFFAFLNSQISKIIVALSGGLIDRLLGLIAGAARGLMICSLLFGAIAIFASNAYVGVDTLKDMADKINPSHYPKWLTRATSYHIIEDSAMILAGLIPRNQLEKIKLPTKPKKIDEVKEDIMNKAMEAGVEHMMNHATSPKADIEHHEEAKDVMPEAHDGSLESELKELMEH